jgi:para-nitrobenzyl esterase
MIKIVKTDKGYVSGTTIGEPGKEVSIFRGIPYAAPPVGDLRWKPPQPVESWEGTRECTKFSNISPRAQQPGMSYEFPLSEDCLYLNVVTPAKQPDEKLPVMVWMHGGGYAEGCGNDKIWNNYRLPQYGVVVVTLNHRLGLFGLFAHPALSKESPQGVSGNYLFLDLIASLQWIQNNIAAFGGDPDNVTIFGESGGGAKVSMMMLSPLAKGLFHRAICESGTSTVVLTGKSLEEVEESGKKLFKELGIDSTDDPLAQARALPFTKILEANKTLEPPRTNPSAGTPPAFAWDAAADGWLLPDSPAKLFKSGYCNPVTLITSANLGELVGPGGLVIPQLIPAYIDMLNCVTKQGCKVYACIFDKVPDSWRKAGGIAVHAIELPYVFGDWDDSTGWWQSIAMLAQQSAKKPLKIELTETDRVVSETMMELWTSYARTGVPKAKGVPNWPVYSADTDKYLYITEKPEVKSGFSKVTRK